MERRQAAEHQAQGTTMEPERKEWQICRLQEGTLQVTSQGTRDRRGVLVFVKACGERTEAEGETGKAVAVGLGTQVVLPGPTEAARLGCTGSGSARVG